MHVARSAADESFIRFNSAREFLNRALLHRQANPMQHEPSGLLRNANRTAQLVRTDSVFRIGNQPKGGQPLIQRDRRILQNGSDLDGKLLLFVLRLAFPNLARGQKENVFGTTAGAFDNAIRPTNRLQKIERMIVVGKILNCIVERLRERDLFRIHATTLTECRGVSSILLP